MAARLGEVLYWAGCILAGLELVIGLVFFWGTPTPDYALYVVFTAILAALIWLVGRGAKYILAGR